MRQVSVSDIQRNLHKLDDFDIIEIIDKKRNKVKGYFIESKYASFVEELAQKVRQAPKKPVTLRGALQINADPKKREKEREAWKEHLAREYADDQA